MPAPSSISDRTFDTGQCRSMSLATVLASSSCSSERSRSILLLAISLGRSACTRPTSGSRPVNAIGQQFCELDVPHLERRRPWDLRLGEEHEEARHLERGEPSSERLVKLVSGQGAPVLEDDRGYDHLSPDRIGKPEHVGLADALDLPKGDDDLARGDVGPRRLDHVVEPALEVQTV